MTDSPKKILIATGIYPPDIGGPATYTKILHNELPKRGIEVKVISFGEVRRFPKIFRHLLYFFKIILRERGCRVIYAQDPVSVGFPAFLAAKISGRKFILKVVGDYAWEQYAQGNHKFITPERFQERRFDWLTETRRTIERFVAKKADKIIVPSFYLRKIVAMWGVPEDKISVIYNAFEYSETKMSKSEARNKLRLNGYVIISAGRLVPWKGFRALIEIMPFIAEKIPDARLYIIGSGSEERILRSLISELKLDDMITLTGKMPRETLFSYLRAGDVFVLNTAYEGLSHQLLEAMALGIPIVTTNVGGNPEIIEHDKNGILVKYDDENELKEAIRSVYENKERTRTFTLAASSSAKNFNKEKMLEETIKVFSVLNPWRA